MQYRKRPIIVEAVQWFPGVEVKGLEYYGNDAAIPTLEGLMVVRPGDWIITGVQGEKYPCKPDVFAATYEPVDEPAEASEAPRVRGALGMLDPEPR